MAKGRVKLNKKEQLLKRLYFDPSKGGSFSGEGALLRAALRANKNKRIKVTLDDVKEFLANNDIHTLHKPIKRRFKRRRIYMGRPFQQWQVDLCDMSAYKEENKARWILMAIDVFTKYTFAEPVMTKSNDDIVAAFNRLLERVPKKEWPEKIQTDKGREFLGEKVQKWSKSKGIGWFTSEDNLIKASIVERVNRSIKDRMFKVFMYRGNKKWEDILQNIIKGYNKSYHSSIKMTPETAHTDDPDVVATVYNNLFGPGNRLDRGLKSEVLRPAGRKVPYNSEVRLGKTKHIFEKGYTPNFTSEVFNVEDVVGTLPQVYKTRGKRGADDSISGTFYPSELQRVGTLVKRRRYYYGGD